MSYSDCDHSNKIILLGLGTYEIYKNYLNRTQNPKFRYDCVFIT